MAEAVDMSEERRKRKPKAAYADYISLFTKVLGELKRDVFTGDLCFFSERHKRWLPVFEETAFGRIRSYAREKDFYTVSACEDYLLRHTFDSAPQLLVDEIQWDGLDRIAEIASCLKCSNLKTDHVYELLCDWGSKMFRRLYDPLIQNRILVIKGAQGIGKDYLIKQMLGGLGQFLIPFQIGSGDKDNAMQMISGLVLWISEYDRTNRVEVAALKNMITADRLYFRSPYDRRPKMHVVRSSWVATCNVEGILRDHTGNRRYIIFDLEKLDRRYPLGDSKQILAQWRHLSSKGFEASPETEAALEAYISLQTPNDPERALVDDFLALYPEHAAKAAAGDIEVRSSKLKDLWKELKDLHDIRPNVIKEIIRRHGYGKRKGGGTYYGTINHLETDGEIDGSTMADRTQDCDQSWEHPASLQSSLPRQKDE